MPVCRCGSHGSKTSRNALTWLWCCHGERARGPSVENIRSWFTYVNDNWEFILEEIINTAQMVLIVIAAATVTSVLLGVFIQRRPVARAVVLALSGIVLT